MFRITKIALIALGLGASIPIASAQYEQLPPPRTARSEGRYHVQIRQPYWKAITFSSEYAMRDFVDSRQRQGWEVQVQPLGYDNYEVRSRLLRWGGTRYGVANTLEDAHWQQRQMESEGYQTQIVSR